MDNRSIAQKNAEYIVATCTDLTRDPHNSLGTPLHKALGLVKEISSADAETKTILRGIGLNLTYPKYLFVEDGISGGALRKESLRIENSRFWTAICKKEEVRIIFHEEMQRFEQEYRALFTREVRRDLRLVFAQDRNRGYWLAQEDPRTKHVFDEFDRLSSEMNDRIFQRLLEMD